MLKATGRTDEVKSVNDYEGVTLYIEYVLKPYFRRIDDKLHYGKSECCIYKIDL